MCRLSLILNDTINALGASVCTAILINVSVSLDVDKAGDDNHCPLLLNHESLRYIKTMQYNTREVEEET